MKWIEYDYICNERLEITLHKKVEYSAENLVIARQEAIDGNYTIVEDAEEPNVIPVSMHNARVTDVADPEQSKDAVNKGYVEANFRKSNWLPSAADVGALSSAGGGVSGPVYFGGIFMLGSESHGTALPPAGNPGRIYLLKVQA